MNLNKETIMLLLSLPLLIIVINQIRLLHFEDIKNSKKMSFKQLDWIINRKRRCKKGIGGEK